MVSPTYQPEPGLEGFVDVLSETVHEGPNHKPQLIKSYIDQTNYARAAFARSVATRTPPPADSIINHRQMCAFVPQEEATKIRMAVKHSKMSSGDLVGILVCGAIRDGWIDDILAHAEVERLKRQYGDKWPTIRDAIRSNG